jgi:hypothetical protein
MGANELRSLLGATPFYPFALVLTGGERLEVRSPEEVAVFWGTAVVSPPRAGRVFVLADIAAVEPPVPDAVVYQPDE